MTRHRIVRIAALAAFACVALACRREEPARADTPQTPAAASAPAQAPPVAPATVPGTDALSVSENTTAQAGVQPAADAKPALSPREFAGSFQAEGMQVRFGADGTYRMAIASPGAQATVESAGTWSIEGDGKAVLLDPDAKDEADRRFEVVSPDTLQGDGQTLRRQKP